MNNNKKLVILIDDDPDILLSFEIILKEKGLDVFTFKNFHDPVSFLENHQPDLIISDLNVNGAINGVEFYVKYIMNKKFKFALHTGSFDPAGKGEGLLFKEFEDHFKIIKEKSTSVSSDQIILAIIDSHNNKQADFPCFCKPTLPYMILNYFGLP
ncbi:MAG: response regulator [Candidatus Aureabacteria bacterium]|nr:response regulator [Candidatus Auribacterota bacterium]